MTKALVLGGGGVAGIAWTTGLLAGLAEAGQDWTDADLVVGTSAGSTVGAQLGSGLSLDELYARQADPDAPNHELTPPVAIAEVWETVVRLQREHPEPGDLRRAVAEYALKADTVSEEERRAVIEARLPSHAWPDRDLRIVAVEASAGLPVVFDRTSGVSLVDAVAASCAVPGVWPPVTISGVRYVDGGVRTSANADFAAGYDDVLVIAPLPDPPLEEQLAGLGGNVRLITPDEASLAAAGAEPLSPASRAPSARAGRVQGASAARA
ncbi:patatin-like phospholipase family protein [Actinomadura rayongensis]|uniref:Patatin-like phospholipase family protein n=1 Tax=Actinomadura rayongensis TaxID=1429076 RepID=A0A6I4W2Q7_9ACTN|nr:patatin-like phospholipase family protein [Actinomadura rayongensis]MXQ62556.1 patatin-like phospholipase family protein [Actinomadura rayongensis]